MFYQLPPVGNPVHFSVDDHPERSLNTFFSPYLQRYYSSGTAALAAAITAAIRKKNVEHPHVLLPAYACPDLISATVFSGAKPVLVDLEPNRPWMDMEQLSASIGSNTVAIVCVNLFGIAERVSQIRAVTEQTGTVLIEDSAQAFPANEASDFWNGDLVVLSFGRGKPVSLLGGGAVLFRDSKFDDLLPAVVEHKSNVLYKRILFQLKVGLYNQVISPRLYWLLQSMPFLHLGETRYHPLSEIEAMDPARLAVLPANIATFQNNDMRVQNAFVRMLEEIDSAETGVIDLPGVCQAPRERRLLRYPLLVEASIRDKLYRQLRRSGLGPSVMYPAALPGISGLETLLSGQGPFPAAEAFATGVLTLPTHGHVREHDIAHIRQLLVSD